MQKSNKIIHLSMFLMRQKKNQSQINLSKRTNQFNGLKLMFLCMDKLIWIITQADLVIFNKATSHIWNIWRQKNKLAI